MEIVLLFILLVVPVILIVDRRYRNGVGKIRNQYGMCYRCNENVSPGLGIPFREGAQFCSVSCADDELHRDENRLLILTSIVGLLSAVFAIKLWEFSVWIAQVYAFWSVIILVLVVLNFKLTRTETVVTDNAIELSPVYIPDMSNQDAMDVELETKEMLEHAADPEEKVALQRILSIYKGLEDEVRRAAELRKRARAYEYQAIIDLRPQVVTNRFTSLLLSVAFFLAIPITRVVESSIYIKHLYTVAATVGIAILYYIDNLRSVTLYKSKSYASEIRSWEILKGDDAERSVIDIYGAPVGEIFYAFLIFVCVCMFVVVGWFAQSNAVIAIGLPVAGFYAINVSIMLARYGKVQLAIKQNGIMLRNGVFLGWSEIEDIQYGYINHRTGGAAAFLNLFVKDSEHYKSVCSWSCRIRQWLGFKSKPFYAVRLYLKGEEAYGVYKLCKTLLDNSQ